jgi:hypothetical protein
MYTPGEHKDGVGEPEEEKRSVDGVIWNDPAVEISMYRQCLAMGVWSEGYILAFIANVFALLTVFPRRWNQKKTWAKLMAALEKEYPDLAFTVAKIRCKVKRAMAAQAVSRLRILPLPRSSCSDWCRLQITTMTRKPEPLMRKMARSPLPTHYHMVSPLVVINGDLCVGAGKGSSRAQ